MNVWMNKINSVFADQKTLQIIFYRPVIYTKILINTEENKMHNSLRKSYGITRYRYGITTGQNPGPTHFGNWRVNSKTRQVY